VVDFLEFKTQLGPVVLPETLMVRLSLGPWRRLGRVGFEAGLHKFDVGLRLFPDTGESRGLNPDILPSINVAGAVTYDLPIWTRFSVHASARVQQRFQHSLKGLVQRDLQNPLDQWSGQLHVAGSFDVTPGLGITAGLAYGQALDNSVVDGVAERARRGTLPWADPLFPQLDVETARERENALRVVDTRGVCAENRTRTLFIDFAEIARPYYASLVDREVNCSLSISGALTYGRTESFDVDLFSAFRLWPELGVLMGAGVRLRIAP
jgi:hypothetical protein